MKPRPTIALALFAVLAACNEPALKKAPEDAGPPVAGLTAEQAARVVAKVGDRSITLGDFARTLDRMDQFNRMRYQSKDRRRELLEEMIDVELLAAEAKRLGLDKQPEAEDAVRTILRDAILADARGSVPAPAQLPEADIRAYYDAHQDKFTEPERRRVAAIVMKDKAEAEKVLKDAQAAKTAIQWGELFFKRSLTAPKKPGPANPAELAGDLGIVGPASDPRGHNDRVPRAVQEMAFKLKAVGDVATELIEEGGKFYIVRLNGITAGHKRTLAESDRAIRVILIQEKLAQAERALEDDLRKKYPVEIDDKALANVKLPAALQPPAQDAPDAGR
jgi:peptidyl-prolyl cis-trans isomerase C